MYHCNKSHNKRREVIEKVMCIFFIREVLPIHGGMLHSKKSNECLGYN